MPLSPIVQALLASSQNQGRMTVGSGLMSLGRSIGTAIAQYKHNKKIEERSQELFPDIDMPEIRQDLIDYDLSATGGSPLAEGPLQQLNPSMLAGVQQAAQQMQGGSLPSKTAGMVPPTMNAPGMLNMGMGQIQASSMRDDEFQQTKAYSEALEKNNNEFMNQMRTFYTSDDPEERAIALDYLKRRTGPPPKQEGKEIGGYIYTNDPNTGKLVKLGPATDQEYITANGKNYVLDTASGRAIPVQGMSGVDFNQGKEVEIYAGDRTLPNGEVVQDVMHGIMVGGNVYTTGIQGPSKRLGAATKVDVSTVTNINKADEGAKQQLAKDAMNRYVTAEFITGQMDDLLTMLSENPSMLDTPTRLRNKYYDVVAKFGPAALDLVGISREQLDSYQDAKAFMRAINQVTTEYIKAMTGAQMSAYEIDRLMAAMPNANDNRYEFQAKAEDVIKMNLEIMAYSQELMSMALSEKKLDEALDERVKLKMDELLAKWGDKDKEDEAYKKYVNERVLPLVGSGLEGMSVTPGDNNA